MSRVVVGVDASDHSLDALRRAVEEAGWRDVPLEVVYAFSSPEPVAAFPVPVDRGSDRADRGSVRAAAEQSLVEWLDHVDVDLDHVEVVRTVIADRKPSRALIERSKGAALVVVASRGRGGFSGLRLGSTSEQVVRHAASPVLVTRRLPS